MDPITEFEQEVDANIERLAGLEDLTASTLGWMLRAGLGGSYTYNFSWLGRPLIQFPQDMVAIQELIWRTKPDLVIETGIAHGGSLIMTASLLAMLDYADAVRDGATLNPAEPTRRVLGVDIDIREHNRGAIETHAMSSRISMIQGSAIDSDVVSQVASVASSHERVMVILDSNHTHDHVLGELQAYAPLVTPDCYCVVFDTLVEDMPASIFTDRPWGPGNSPKSAVWEYLKEHPEFEVDKKMDAKLQISVAPDGYLRRLK
jgi:cephalosporin hydroxylase